ncbi:MAG: 30S ribosomal protein S5, partial [Patescibacteria group bacterium]
MEENTKTTEEVIETTPVVQVDVQPAARFRRVDNRGDRGGRRPNRRTPRRGESRVKPEFDQKIVSLRRVTRVMAGGRRFSFSVALVAGNRKGMVGVGQGKATDTPLAIEKAFRDAKKNMITINTTKDMSIPHDVEAKYAASVVKIMPAPGKGLLAGSSVRTVFELAGLKDIGAKLLSRSKNSANNAYVAIKALKKLE